MKSYLFLLFVALSCCMPIKAQEASIGKLIVPLTNATQAKPVNKANIQEADATLPIVSDEVISEAPAGTAVKGALRSGFSYYYSAGNVLGGFNDSFVGEYVLGNDGNIYIKTPCASADINSYIKLDKIDDENYVAHTAQLIYVDYSSSTPNTFFAGRLVFKSYSANSYGYTVETDNEGNAIADVYFTYKDGVLQQKDQTTVVQNGETFPHEMIGWVNSSGAWVGFGDACLTFKPVADQLTVLPEGATIMDGGFTYNVLSSIAGTNQRDGKMVKYAEVGDEIFIKNPVGEDSWIKGTINRNDNTATFKKQYLGINEENKCHQWFVPATYNDEFELWDEESGFGVWHRGLTTNDELVCKYDNGSISTLDNAKQVFLVSRSMSGVLAIGTYSDFALKPYNEGVSKPMKPTIINVESFNGLYGVITCALPPIDENNNLINSDYLYYNIYIANENTPYTFDKDIFELKEDMTDVPYKFDDDMDFDCNGTFHTIYHYEENSDYLGVQTIYRRNGVEKRSDIAWFNHTTGINNTTANAIKNNNIKKIENGNLVIIHNGHRYNAQGQLLK